MQLINYVSHTGLHFFNEESGASFIEYALIGSLIAVVIGLFLLAFIKSF